MWFPSIILIILQEIHFLSTHLNKLTNSCNKVIRHYKDLDLGTLIKKMVNKFDIFITIKSLEVGIKQILIDKI